MRFVGALLIALAIAAAPFSWRYAQTLIPAPEPDAPQSVSAGAAPAALEAEVAFLSDQLARLSQRVDALDSRTALNLASVARPLEPRAALPEASDSLKDAFAQVVLIADRRSANDGLRHATPSFLRELIGLPRPDLTDTCQSATNPKLRDLLSTEDVGPIRATMVRPALVSIRQVFANVQVFEPELYDRIKTAGSLCVRRIRGAQSAASAHAYGLAGRPQHRRRARQPRRRQDPARAHSAGGFLQEGGLDLGRGLWPRGLDAFRGQPRQARAVAAAGRDLSASLAACQKEGPSHVEAGLVVPVRCFP